MKGITNISGLYTILILLLMPGINTYAQNNQTELRLCYNRPAKVWEEALPLGNGSLGAMVYGDPLNEIYQLNEETLWSEEPRDCNNPNSKLALPEIRKAIENRDYKEAGRLWRNNSQGPYTARYLPMANVFIHTELTGEIKNYYRDLNISDATTIVSFEINGVKHKRTSFISYPDQVMVIKFEASEKRSINFNLSMNSLLKYNVFTSDNNKLILKGKAPKHVAHRPYESPQIEYADNDRGEGMNFNVVVEAILNDGKVTKKDGGLDINNSSEVVLIVSAATSYNGFDKSPSSEGKDPFSLASQRLEKASRKTYSELLNRHTEDYKSLFDRVKLELENTSEVRNIFPTDERIRQFSKNSSDNGLIVLLYQYGRYLTIASSRPNCLPTNLQGIWNQHIQPPWGSNYTTNINTQMNYWPAEVTNLAECHQPLIDFIKSLSVNGKKTAQINYGIESGWVAHHNSDVWAQTAPTGDYDKDPKSGERWSCWPLAGAWFCKHLWDHYLFGGDKEYLSETAYPLMKGAATFLLEWLHKDEQSGYYITNPSSSPENRFKYPDKEGNMQIGEISKSTTMDMALIRDLFSNCIEASEILDIDNEFRKDLSEKLSLLYPIKIGSKGQLLEWSEEFEEADPHHRHISHLYGLYPGSQISPRFNSPYSSAAEKSMILRGDEGPGWSTAWKISLWARLENGEKAYSLLKKGLEYVDANNNPDNKSGIYGNLFVAYPPFQIDGNFGITAGISEMLIQSHAGEIFLLPALPKAWKKGSAKGLRTRGGFVVDMEWDDNQLTKVDITSTLGGVCRIRTYTSLKLDSNIINSPIGANPNPFFSTTQMNGNGEIMDKKNTIIYEFETKKSQKYHLGKSEINNLLNTNN